MNKARLRYEMEKRGISIAKMCSTLGMSRSAFYRKRAGVSEFTQKEIQQMVNIMDLDTPVGIFFEEKVS